ncbi:MAG: hypothetical protein R3321_00785, partial [Nitrososphaeraceae archaeon]|nr:hypothetical protein [Nitrososphaeraceae archaeon]
MNIFLLNKDVELNAQAYMDSHIRKIPVEINQMLATALSLYSDDAVIHKVNGKPYTPCFHHHPCTKWVAQSRKNFIYAIEVSLELHNEYYTRW